MWERPVVDLSQGSDPLFELFGWTLSDSFIIVFADGAKSFTPCLQSFESAIVSGIENELSPTLTNESDRMLLASCKEHVREALHQAQKLEELLLKVYMHRMEKVFEERSECSAIAAECDKELGRKIMTHQLPASFTFREVFFSKSIFLNMNFTQGERGICQADWKVFVVKICCCMSMLKFCLTSSHFAGRNATTSFKVASAIRDREVRQYITFASNLANRLLLFSVHSKR